MSSNVTIFKYIRLHIPSGTWDECQIPTKAQIEELPIEVLMENCPRTKEAFLDKLSNWNRIGAFGVMERVWLYAPIE